MLRLHNNTNPMIRKKQRVLQLSRRMFDLTICPKKVLQVDATQHNELMLYFEGVYKARNNPGFTFL